MATEPIEEEVRAAGGLVVRGGGSAPEVAVIHRPRHDDWSLPKGKLDPGEGWAAAALREVAEETGFECELGEELPEVVYRDRSGRPKRVRWWRMQPLGGRFTPNDEVDELRWLSPREAIEQLDYEPDRALVRLLFG